MLGHDSPSPLEVAAGIVSAVPHNVWQCSSGWPHPDVITRYAQDQTTTKRCVFVCTPRRPSPDYGPYEISVPMARKDVFVGALEAAVAEGEARRLFELLRAFDAVIFLPRAGSGTRGRAPPDPAVERAGCCYDFNRGLISLGHWLGGRRVVGRDAIDIIVGDPMFPPDTAWFRLAGTIDGVSLTTGLPSYGPRGTMSCDGGSTYIWQTFDSDRGNHSIMVELLVAPDNGVRVLMGPTVPDPDSPSGFEMDIGWVSCAPLDRTITMFVARENAEMLLVRLEIGQSSDDQAHLPIVGRAYLWRTEGPVCVAEGTLPLSSLGAGVVAFWSILSVRMGDQLRDNQPIGIPDEATRTGADMWNVIVAAVQSWLKGLTEPMRVPSDSFFGLGKAAAGLISDPFMWGGDFGAKLGWSAPIGRPTEALRPITRANAPTAWIPSAHGRLRCAVAMEDAETMCCVCPLTEDVVRIARAAACHAPTLDEKVRESLLYAGVVPSWEAVRMSLGAGGEHLGARALHVGARVFSTIDVSRLGRPAGQAPARASAYGALVEVVEYNSCGGCRNQDCYLRRYCCVGRGIPTVRMTDSMLAFAPPTCQFKLGAVVHLTSARVTGHGVVCGGGICVTGRDVVHLVMLEADASRYVCTEADHVVAVSDDEARALLAPYNCSRETTPEQDRLQDELIQAEEKRKARRTKKQKRADARAAQTALIERATGQWRHVALRMGDRVGFDRVGCVVLEIVQAFATDGRRLVALLERYAPWLLKCPLSGRRIRRPKLASNGHVYDAAPLAEHTRDWPDRPDRLPTPGPVDPDTVVPLARLLDSLDLAGRLLKP
jgi:hypothetical protein